MPHTVSEHSKSAGLPSDLKPFFIDLHRQLAATGIVELPRLKGRSVRHEDVVVADSTDLAFIFLQLAVLSGRSLEQRQQLSEVSASVLKKWAGVWKLKNVASITVEVREIENETHQRVTLD